MATLPVKWYSAHMQGAPATAANDRSVSGKLVAILDACLVDGFNLVTLDSLVVAGNMATATRSAGCSYMPNQVIEIAGATPSALNGQWRVYDAPTGQTIRFQTTGISDQTATGTITCKTPSLGWERVFSSGHSRVYRSPNTDSPRSYYRINDTYVTNEYVAKVTAARNMTAIDAYTDPWITDSTTPGIGLPRPNHAYWALFGDDRTVYWFLEASNSQGSPWNGYGFGDYTSFLPNDAYNELLLQGNAGSSASFTCRNVGILNSASSNADAEYPEQRYIARAYGGTPIANRMYFARQINDASGYSGLPFPAAVENNLLITDAIFREYDASSDPIRGALRGMYWVLSNQPLQWQYAPHLVTGVVGLEGRLCMLMSFHFPQTVGSNSVYVGRALIDITGPWAS